MKHETEPSITEGAPVSSGAVIRERDALSAALARARLDLEHLRSIFEALHANFIETHRKYVALDSLARLLVASHEDSAGSVSVDRAPLRALADATRLELKNEAVGATWPGTPEPEGGGSLTQERGAFNRAARRSGGERPLAIRIAGRNLKGCINCGRLVPEDPIRRSCAEVPGAWCRMVGILDYDESEKDTLATALGRIVLKSQHPNSVAWVVQSHLEHLGFVTMTGRGDECRLVPTDAGRAWLEYWVSGQLKTAVQP